MHKLKAIKIATYVLYVLTLIILIITISLNSKLYAHALPYKAPEDVNIEYDITIPPKISYQSLTEEVNALFDNPSYKLEFTTFSGAVKGKCYLWTRTIQLQENLNYEYYTFCLTHELVHLTEFNIQERYTNLTTFYTLYNSGNDYFKNIALYFADLDLNGAFSEEYSFVGYLNF